MKITELSIKKPIAITMITITCILFGIMGYINLGANLFPQVNMPVVVINSFYPGAGAEEIEKDIAKPIEDAVSVISGVDKVYTTTAEGYANVVVMFKMSADPQTTIMDAQKAIDSVAGKLPQDATKPTLFKYDMNAEPILILALSGDKPYEEIYDQARNLKETIEKIEGVGNVELFGERQKELMIKLDKSRLEFYNLNIPQIVSILKANNLSIPGGTISQPKQDKIVRVDGEFKDINEVRSFKIPINEGYVQLGDIAEISLEYPKEKQLSRLSDKTAIGITVQKQSDANIVETGKRVKTEIEKIIPNLKGTDLKLVDDATVFITSSLNETKRNLIEGVITTGIVLLLFLRRWKSTLIAMVAIPTSLISTFFMMYVFGFTFNILSLMGLALCVGILVDDSVVVLENISRHLGMGKGPKTAAIDGRNEIGMAAIAITLSDVVVFAPIAFMSGMIGQYFKQFGLTVVFATLFSLAVSFTLTPMMASRMLKHSDEDETKEKTAFGKLIDSIGSKVKLMYQWLLTWSLNNRKKVLAMVIALVALSASLIPLGFIGTDFMPRIDESQFTINLELTPGSTLQSTDEKVKFVENYVKTIPEATYYYSRVGMDDLTNKASIFVKLVDKKDRKKGQSQLVSETRAWMTKNITGASVTLSEPSIGGPGGKPVYVRISGKKNDVIDKLAKEVETIVKSTTGTTDISNSLQGGKPEISIQMNRVEADRYGITAYDISNAVRSALEGSKAGMFKREDEDFDIRVKLLNDQITDLNTLSNLKVSNTRGTQVSLSQVAQLTMNESPTVIKRENKQRVANITANLVGGYTLGEVNSQIEEKLQKLDVPSGYSVSITGEQEDMDETFRSLIQVLILSIALVYIILVILYESFLTPFVRILALPVGMIGALIMLAVTGHSLNMLSMIGLIMLDGLAAKNGTLLIDYTNTLMTKGISLRDALYQAGTTRLKPIFMTSLAMIVGMLPTALAIGDGSEVKSGLALVIIGGMITSTILSPILLPVAYTLIDDFRNWMRNKLRHKQQIITVDESI